MRSFTRQRQRFAAGNCARPRPSSDSLGGGCQQPASQMHGRHVEGRRSSVEGRGPHREQRSERPPLQRVLSPSLSTYCTPKSTTRPSDRETLTYGGRRTPSCVAPSTAVCNAARKRKRVLCVRKYSNEMTSSLSGSPQCEIGKIDSPRDHTPLFQCDRPGSPRDPPPRATPGPHASSRLPTPGPHARPWGGSRRRGLSPPWGSQ